MPFPAVVLLGYTDVDSTKYESALINQAFATNEVENKIAEAENLVNQYTGKTRTNPWVNTDDMWESVASATRFIASALLLGKYATRSIDAKAKMDMGIRILKINFHVTDAQTDSQNTAVVVSGAYEADTFGQIIRKPNILPFDIDSDVEYSPTSQDLPV